jgi:hypothetical protein
MLHDAPLPPWSGCSLDAIASHLDGKCDWLVTSGVLTTDVVTRNRRVARLRSGRGHRCSRTATCGSPTCSSTLTLGH